MTPGFVLLEAPPYPGDSVTASELTFGEASFLEAVKLPHPAFFFCGRRLGSRYGYLGLLCADSQALASQGDRFCGKELPPQLDRLPV